VAPGNVLANVEWIYDFAPRFGRTITWSAILAFPEGSGQIDWRQKLGVHRAHPGADVHPQVTSRVLTFEWGLENPLTLYRYPSFGDLGRSDAPARRSSFADPAWRARARAEMEAGIPTDWRRMRIVASDQPGVAGRTLDRLAAERGGHPLDVLLDVGLADDLATRVEVEAANVDEAAVAELLTAPGCLLGLSDAGAHVGQLCDAVLPLHFLAEWVRDRDLLPVAEGLRKTSAEIADVLGLADRGYLRPGARADLVVLDWEDLSPGPATRVRDLPGGGERLVADSPGGLRHVLVNGRPIRREGEPCRPERRPGQLLGPKRYP
jgi:N-acyl-D-aspartate/D-glutamate deacylase